MLIIIKENACVVMKKIIFLFENWTSLNICLKYQLHIYLKFWQNKVNSEPSSILWNE
jgi:hypothetical protein